MAKKTGWSVKRSARAGWGVLSMLIVEMMVLGFSALPAVLFWQWHFDWEPSIYWVRALLLCLSLVPSYIIFALTMMLLSAVSMRVLGWRTPVDTEMPIREIGWPLLNWARYSVSIHLVRIFAGTFFRATPVWTWYMRLNGAKLGEGVHVNSLALGDHNLLEFGDGVVIGGGVHLSGHTVERGVVKTARVQLGAGVTVGVGAVVEIGVEAGEGAQIGALAFVPKHSKLEAGASYVGIPARRM